MMATTIPSIRSRSIANRAHNSMFAFVTCFVSKIGKYDQVRRRGHSSGTVDAHINKQRNMDSK